LAWAVEEDQIALEGLKDHVSGKPDAS
jgi:hypothetical protein